jgi:hypothetical protein
LSSPLKAAAIVLWRTGDGIMAEYTNDAHSDSVSGPRSIRPGLWVCQKEENGLYVLMQASARTVSKRFSPSLAKGQLWKTHEAYIRIVELGKKLLDYRMMRELGQMRRTQTTTHQAMEAYLRTNEGRLVRGHSRN